MKKNGFLTFIFAFIPGAGQMYQEHMKRGLSMMLLFALFFCLAVLTGSVIFIVPIFIIMAYSFFDTFNIRNMTEESASKYKDEYLWNSDEFGRITKNNKLSNYKKIIGVIFIILGIYLLIDSVLIRILWEINIPILIDIFSTLTRYFPTIFASLIAVFIGMKLISKEKE